MQHSGSNICLIVEGGGFKTGFTTGVLDAFLVSRYRPFNRYIGISGGSVAVSYFLGHQYRQCLKAILRLINDANFIQYRRTFGKQGFMDIDFMGEVATGEVRFNLDKALEAQSDSAIHFIATNRQTGQPAYLRPDRSNWIDLVIASCTLPFVTKGKHLVHGIEYFDGGWSDPIPVKWAYEQGARQIIVIRTWPLGHQFSQSWIDYLGSKYYSTGHPHLSKVFEVCHEHYNAALTFMDNPPDDLVVHQIAPAKLLKSTTYSQSKKTIMRDYRYGVDVGLQYVAQWVGRPLEKKEE